ncbi:DUF3572 family protein [Sphingobium aquiterrae]|uniref:DUF3572 family protein n=1 Tax=Sphingobium aquiterrae TaxID=2038656 RepID=UPI003016F6B5
MRESERNGKSVDAEILGLQALAWVMADASRAQRLLDMTGLTPDALRSGLGDPAILGAVLAFLAAHEPDLIACAAALEHRPEALVAALEALA